MARKYRKRRRRLSRRKRRINRYRRGNSTEVKYYTDDIQNQSLQYNISTTDQDTLYANQTYLSNILANILQGVGSGARIGNKIYVMKIAVRMHVWTCPTSDLYVVGPFLIRHLWHNSPSSAGVAVPDFFLAPARTNFIHWPDRRLFTVHKDKYYTVSNGVFNVDLGGCTRYISYNIPVNRYVTYNLSNKPKEDYNVYSLAMIAAASAMGDSANNGRQVACFNLTYRIYFKDA